MLVLLGALVVFIQLIGVQSGVPTDRVDLPIKIISRRTFNSTIVNPNQFINGLFGKFANAESTEKALPMGYKKSRYHDFETSELSGMFITWINY